MTSLPVPLYIPNLLGYGRILLALIALGLSKEYPVAAVFSWILSALLDLFDGVLARLLHQTSSFGVLLDIAADNILRTSMWVAAAGQYPITAVLVISLEWCTMTCTQLHSTQSGEHWKSLRADDPWWVQSVFANNFRTPLGTWCILGLFCSGMFAYGTQHNIFLESIPFYHLWMYLAFGGRLLSALVEMHLLLGYVGLVIDRDTKESEATTRKPHSE